MFLGPANEFSTDKHHGPDGTAGVGPAVWRVCTPHSDAGRPGANGLGGWGA